MQQQGCWLPLLSVSVRFPDLVESMAIERQQFDVNSMLKNCFLSCPSQNQHFSTGTNVAVATYCYSHLLGVGNS